MLFLCVQDRETEKWRVVSPMPFLIRTEHTNKRGQYSSRGRNISYQPNCIFPKPENVNCFIKAHKIIEANTEEEACQILS